MDNAGHLSFHEFAKLMKPTLRDPLRLTSKQQELLETFKVFDRDGDGVINAQELTAMMHQLGDKITIEEAKQLINEVDEDKDGVVNFDEFARMMGVQPPDSPTAAAMSTTRSNSRGSIQLHSSCAHSHHRFSLRRFFCKQSN
jgi:Ca2+-binding EF-hand superfamily protein